jgi:hypothetical protein
LHLGALLALHAKLPREERALENETRQTPENQTSFNQGANNPPAMGRIDTPRAQALRVAKLEDRLQGASRDSRGDEGGFRRCAAVRAESRKAHCRCLRWGRPLVGCQALHQRGCEAAQEKTGRVWVVSAQLLMGPQEASPYFAGQSQGATKPVQSSKGHRAPNRQAALCLTLKWVGSPPATTIVVAFSTIVCRQTSISACSKESS